MDKVLSVIFMIGVLVLVLPAFLKSNSTLKLFLKNLSIWALIVIVILANRTYPNDNFAFSRNNIRTRIQELFYNAIIN